ncbi:MAG: hypothetical protein LV473_20515 [Nitrospira sp.]|nr:hypothetical protein [Nitrospira sp.]
MHTKQPNTIDPIIGDHVSMSEDGPSRCDIPVQGGKIADDVGVAALLGNIGLFLSRSYGMDRPTTSLLDSLTPARTAFVESGIFGEVVITAQVLE